MVKLLLTPIAALVFLLSLNIANSQNSDPTKQLLDAQLVTTNKIAPGFYLLHLDCFESLKGQSKVKLVQRRKERQCIVKFFETTFIEGTGACKIYSINNRWKASPSLHYADRQYFNRILISSLSNASLKENLTLKNIAYKVIEEREVSITIDIAAKDIETILGLPQVTYVEPISRPVVETNVVGMDLSVNSFNQLRHEHQELSGEALRVSIKEQLFDILDIDIINRHVLFGNENETIDYHATEMASLIAGAGNQSKKSLGIATASEVTSSDFLTLLPDPDDLYTDNGIFVQNHSYGLQYIESHYGSQAHSYDQNTLNIPELVHVFSSGNSGEETPSSGPYAGIEGYSNLTGNFKTGKNVLTIGSVNNIKQVEAQSSKGPAHDGRLKPEFVAYGPQGTSDAAATVSGLCILLQEAFIKKQDKYPPSSLLKAVLMVGAEDVGPRGIDFKSGFGNINAKKSHDVLQNDQFSIGELDPLGHETFNINVPENTHTLKVGLAWNDLPANPGDDAPALVNDLDLSLSLNDSRWLPWVLNSYPHIDSLTQLPKRSVDRLNTMEFISVENPQSGTYSVDIASKSNDNKQAYAVAYLLERENTFSWVYPTGSDHLNNEMNETIRWEHTFEHDNFSLEFNLNKTGWQTLEGTATTPDANHFIWTTNGLTGKAQLRMVTGTEVFESDEVTISKALVPKILYNCDDLLGISWQAVENATSYLVKALGTFTMQTVVETEDTSAAIPKVDLNAPYISVTPKFDDAIGLRGEAINYELQGVQCYYRNFLAFLNDDDKVEITLNLSTLENIREVEIIRVDRLGEITPLNSFAPPFGSTSFEEIDQNPSPGVSSYSAIITLEDGNKVQTDEVEIEFPFQDKLDIFPNPTNSELDLEVFTRGNDLTFRLLDMRGRVVRQEQVLRRSFLIDIPTVSPGLYIAQLLKGDRLLNAKKVVITH